MSGQPIGDPRMSVLVTTILPLVRKAVCRPSVTAAARTPGNRVADAGREQEGTTMASKESQRVNRYWETVQQFVLAPRPDNLVTNAQWDVLTGEPGGVDYLEIDAGGCSTTAACSPSTPSRPGSTSSPASSTPFR